MIEMRGTLIAAALALAGSGCVGTGPEPAATPGTGASTLVRFEDLAAALFDAVPPGYAVVKEETRGLLIEDVIAGADDPTAERTRLERHGFKRGFIRTWASDDESENVVYAFVYEFASGQGAEADAADGLAEARSEGDATFDVPGVEGATGITRKPKPGVEGDDATFQAVVFVRGNRYFLVAVGGPSNHKPEEAIGLAETMLAAAEKAQAAL